jgi:hypothetical protein
MLSTKARSLGIFEIEISNSRLPQVFRTTTVRSTTVLVVLVVVVKANYVLFSLELMSE